MHTPYLQESISEWAHELNPNPTLDLTIEHANYPHQNTYIEWSTERYGRDGGFTGQEGSDLMAITITATDELEAALGHIPDEAIVAVTIPTSLAVQIDAMYAEQEGEAA